MLLKLKQALLQVHTATGIEISFLSNEELMINAVVLKLVKNKIVKDKDIQFLNSLEQLSGKITPAFPVAVTINGKGVLHKKVPLEALSANPFENILPNANPAEFYMEVTRFESFASIYIIRNEQLDKIIEDLQRQKFKILSVALGAANIQYLAPYINFEQQTIVKTNNYAIHFSDKNQVTDIENYSFNKEEKYNKTEYNIGDQYVLSQSVLSFGSAIGLLANGLTAGTDINNEALLKARGEYRWFAYYKTAVWALLISVFVILLVNFFVYNHYFSKNMEQQATQSYTSEQGKKAGKLLAGIAGKEKFLQQYGWSRSSKLSFFADRIAGLLPDGAMLTNMKIFPINTGFISESSMLTFKKDTIQMTGTCEDPTELNRFVNNLKNITDFREVNIKNYTYKKETENGIFLMEIIAK